LTKRDLVLGLLCRWGFHRSVGFLHGTLAQGAILLLGALCAEVQPLQTVSSFQIVRWSTVLTISRL
jgi:hypothetical protein